MRFKNRVLAGQHLASVLSSSPSAPYPNAVVLGLPRGGVPVAFEVARELKAKLGVLIVRKIGTPWNEELAMGAVAAVYPKPETLSEGIVTVRNDDIIKLYGISRDAFEAVKARQVEELRRRVTLYSIPEGHVEEGATVDWNLYDTVLLVDDGIATGATVKAAIKAVKLLKKETARIVVATPVAPVDVVVDLKNSENEGGEGVEVVAAMVPEYFGGVGAWYDDFGQTPDEEVVRLLKQAAKMDTGAVREE